MIIILFDFFVVCGNAGICIFAAEIISPYPILKGKSALRSFNLYFKNSDRINYRADRCNMWV